MASSVSALNDNIISTNKRSNSRHIIIVLSLCILWYIVSSSNNVIGKIVLNEFPYPMTITMIQLCSITLYSGPFFNLWHIRKYQDLPRNYYIKLIIPLAFGKFLSSVTSHISLWKVPVSYAHTVKATMPLFTVILTRLLFHETQPLLVYLSLIPIITGVAIATMTEISFDMIGLISALISTMGFSLQNIFSKKVLKDTGIHHLRLLHLLGKLALIMFLPIWVYIDSIDVIKHPAILNFDYRVIALLFTDGVLNWLQNIIAFSVLSLVTPLTYAVASASKRIFVIGVSLVILGNPVTWLNCFGMTLAIIGVLCYNRAKHIARSKSIIPLTQENGKRLEYLSLIENSNDLLYYENSDNTKNNRKLSVSVDMSESSINNNNNSKHLNGVYNSLKPTINRLLTHNNLHNSHNINNNYKNSSTRLLFV